MQKLVWVLGVSLLSGLLIFAIYTSIPTKQKKLTTMSSPSVTRYFHVWGKVQKVMFRQVNFIFEYSK